MSRAEPRTRSRFWSLVLSSAIVVMATQCSDRSPAAPAPTSAATLPPAAPALSAFVVTVPFGTIAVGDDETATAIATFADGTQKDVTAQAAWKSSDTTQLAVTNDGKITGIAGGSTDVLASYQGSSAKRQIIVLNIDAVFVTAPTSQFNIGDTVNLSASALLGDRSFRDITATATWESSASAVASIAAGGALHVNGPGAADIKAIFRTASGTAHVSVPSAPAPSPTPTVCTYAVDGIDHFFGIGSQFQVKVKTQPGCPWSVSSDSALVGVAVIADESGTTHGSPKTGSGSGTALVWIDPDLVVAIKGAKVTIAGRTGTITH